jgi:hypothetical protein
VYDRGRNRIGGLEGLAVTGRCGKIDPAMSTRMQKIWPGGVFPSFKGYFFKPESWDGSDMFCPERTAHVFVTSPVRELLRRSKVTNVAFRPIIDIEFGEVSKSLLERRLAE